ncbi:hypothetical protein [Micromonospora globbae]|uniref:Uncharacterized protein n=1 Tax=Micromonospora globbae TaxID=1894969 RepID=A0A420EV89_9ACTN|nr:hypothetical protein [Micromonospora globbae]RKF24628.1 hypothetical protein D7I43_24920 [Micromonospora globbae]
MPEGFVAWLPDSVTTIVVEYQAGRCGSAGSMCDAALATQGRRLLAADPAGVDDDLVGDVTEVSLCVRFYEELVAADRARHAVEAVIRDDSAC